MMLPTSTKRRTVFFGACAIAALGWARLVFAQQKKPLALIGWLHPGYRQADGHHVGAFKEGMTALGWRDGVNFTVDERWMEGRVERIEPLAAELAAKRPAAFVTYGSGPARAAAKTSSATPIVQVAGIHVEAGLAKSLARPGGMVTGLTNLAYDLAEKRLELLFDAVPGLFFFLIGFRNRLIVMIEWAWAYWTLQCYARIVFGPDERRR